jgi:DNA polymerase phi
MDLLDIFIRRQPTSPLILQFLVPLLALTFSDDKQVSEKATGLLMSRIGRLKDIPSSIDIAKSSVILDNLHIRARKVRSRDAVAIISRCSLYVSKALLHVGADETVRMAYTVSLVDFTERKSSDLNGQFFSEFIKRYPRTAWGMRAALLSASTKAINSYRRGQAYMLLETLLNHLPCPVGVVHHYLSFYFAFTANDINRKPDQGLDEVAIYIRELQFGLHSTLSAACDPCLKSISVSSIKEALKLVIVAARTTKRLVAKSGSFSNIWDSTIWTELHKRLVAQDRFVASTALVGMCKQVIELVQTQQALPSTGAGECLKGRGQRDGITAGNKRKASTNDVDLRGKKSKRVSTPATRGPGGKKSNT